MMFSKKILVGTIGSSVLLIAGYSYAAQIDSIDQLVSREASEAPRGADRIHSGTHKNSIDAVTILAREATEGPRGGDNERPGDRQRRGGRVITEDAGQFILAREASEGPRGGDNERPGDRQRRGGRTG